MEWVKTNKANVSPIVASAVKHEVLRAAPGHHALLPHLCPGPGGGGGGGPPIGQEAEAFK